MQYNSNLCTNIKLKFLKKYMLFYDEKQICSVLSLKRKVIIYDLFYLFAAAVIIFPIYIIRAQLTAPSKKYADKLYNS